jgi:hypothetical protein
MTLWTLHADMSERRGAGSPDGVNGICADQLHSGQTIGSTLCRITTPQDVDFPTGLGILEAPEHYADGTQSGITHVMATAG